MPSASTSHATIPTIPGSEGRVDSNVGVVDKMDDAVRKVGSVVTGAPTATERDNNSTRAVVDDRKSIAPVAGGGKGSKQPHNKHGMDYIIRSFVAGGIAGCAGKTTVAPLDRVKILFQTSNPQFAKYQSSWAGMGRAIRDIYGQNGMMGLFRGHSATLLKIYPYAAIKFVAYEQYRALLIGSRNQETWSRRFAAGALAGVTSVFFTYPLEVIRVRLAFETKIRSSSLADICRKIYHEHPRPVAPKPSAAAATESVGTAASAVATATARIHTAPSSITSPVMQSSGLVNFYRGFSTTILGMIPYAGVSFLTHDTAGDVFRLPSLRQYTTLPQPANAPADKPAPLRAWAELAAGGISGVVSQTVSYPLEVIRRRMQVGGAVGDGHRLRIAETAGMIFRQKGIPGFFVGLTIGYIKILPMSAVSFYSYERTKTFFGI